jgi:hypothetical protein
MYDGANNHRWLVNMNISTRSLLETASVIVTGILHLIFVEVFGARAVFITLALIAWTIYIVVRVRKRRELLRLWGFRRDNIKSTFIVSSFITAFGILLMASTAMSRGSLALHWHMLVLLLLYPIWGVIQQFLVQALVAGNLSRASGFIGSPWMVTIVCAVLFASVHLPDLTFAIATFLLGLAFTPIYLQWRNLWPLGLYHGWLGVFLYFWVLNRDPWIEVFGRL